MNWKPWKMRKKLKSTQEALLLSQKGWKHSHDMAIRFRKDRDRWRSVAEKFAQLNRETVLSLPSEEQDKYLEVLGAYERAIRGE
jgi:hypothetical protein